MQERTFTISGFSKTFSMTGWRLGTVVGPKEAMETLRLMNDALCVCAPTPLQYGVAAAWEHFNETERVRLISTYQKKRDLFLELLKKTVLRPILPEGAYYLLADVSPLGCSSSEEATLKIVHEAKVATVAGSAFFTSPEKDRYIRFCFAKSDEDRQKAGEQLIRAFGK
jgi:aminotransferase